MENWQELARETVFNKYKRRVEKTTYRLPNGQTADFHITADGEVVCIVPFTIDQQVILTRQFRPGPNKILLELPGGFIDDNESPEQAAAREFLEETGYQGTLQYIGDTYDDAYSTRVRHCFVALNCKKVSAQKLDSREFIEVAFLTLPEFRQLLRSGQMTDVEAGYLALDHLKLL